MSLPQYREYTDSGIDWLGSVPTHWHVVPIKHLGKLKGGAGFPHENQGAEGKELSFHKVNAIGSAGFAGALLASENTISRETAKKLGAFIFPVGTIVFAKVGAALLLGRIRWLRTEACIDNNMMGLIIDDVFACSKFVRYAMGLVRFDLIANPGTVPSLNESQIGNFPLAFPQLPEQRTIASFLDRETAKIDGLISEQEKLITLLAEKRQATISHAVTKGLNPDASMKDSGVEWLGAVPEHWTRTRVKFIVSDEDGIQMGPFGGMLLDLDTESTGYKVYGQENTISGDFYLGNRWISERRFHDLEKYQIVEGDLVLTRKGSLGNARLISQLPQSGIADSDTIRLRVDKKKIRSRFLSLLFHEVAYVAEQISFSKRGAILSGINSETIANIVVILPPISEQDELLTAVDKKMSDFEIGISNCKKVVSLLKERRSALISAAVTGKIDVRQVVQQEQITIQEVA